MRVKCKDIFGLRGRIKMATNPPQCIVDADYCIIMDGMIWQYVGIGWVDVRKALPEDAETIPEVFSPHCSQCKFYEVLANHTMYCHQLQKRITARKKPCKKYDEK